MTWLEIRPQDVWLFRDGRPFNAGEDNSAQSMFPPTPMTLQGALRQQISESHGLSYGAYKAGKSELAQKVGRYIGTYEAQKEQLEVGTFKMRGPFIGLNTGEQIMPLLPAPADLLKKHDKENNTHHFKITKPRSDVVISDLGNQVQLVEVYDDYENMPKHWLTADGFQEYLNGQVPESDQYFAPDDPILVQKSAYQAVADGYTVLPNKLLYTLEGRFGVATDSATSFREEGQLYQAQFVRVTENVALIADVTGDHGKEYATGRLTLGGERRHAMSKQISNPPLLSNPLKQISDRFKIVFLTPAYFAEGWLPTQGDWSPWFGENAKLISAVLYRPEAIGGWNSATGGQRPMHRYVAPGSVYYFETDQAFKPPKAITESPPDIADASAVGFGQVIYGEWS